MLERLPYAKRLELERRGDAERYASLAGLELVLMGAALLRHVPTGADALRFPADGKPYCIGGPFFSLSHGTDRVAAAFSTDCEIGFDLEEIGSGSGDTNEAQVRLLRWTATEAVLKAAGRGLRDARAVELDAALATAALAGAVFQLRSVSIATDVVAHLAAPVTVESVTIEAVVLPA